MGQNQASRRSMSLPVIPAEVVSRMNEAGINQSLGSICLSPEQQSYLTGLLFARITEFGTFMLLMGLIFGGVIGVLVWERWFS
jgi:hypothetical protein